MEHNGWTNCIWKASSLQNLTSQIELASRTRHFHFQAELASKFHPDTKGIIHYIKNIMVGSNSTCRVAPDLLLAGRPPLQLLTGVKNWVLVKNFKNFQLPKSNYHLVYLLRTYVLLYIYIYTYIYIGRRRA